MAPKKLAPKHAPSTEAARYDEAMAQIALMTKQINAVICADEVRAHLNAARSSGQ